MSKTKLKPNIGVKSIILIVVCGLLIAADLLTKYFEEFYCWDITIIPGFIEIANNIRNPGCAFSFLNDNPAVGQPILISLTMVMLVFLVFVFIVAPERSGLIKIAVSIVIAGAIGNLVDRFMLHEVRDFIGLNMLFNRFNLVYCNLADFYIVIGVFMVIIDMLFINESAMFPLSKRAKEAQAKRRAEEQREQEENDKSNALNNPPEENFQNPELSGAENGEIADGPQNEGGNEN